MCAIGKCDCLANVTVWAADTPHPALWGADRVMWPPPTPTCNPKQADNLRSLWQSFWQCKSANAAPPELGNACQMLLQFSCRNQLQMAGTEKKNFNC